MADGGILGELGDTVRNNTINRCDPSKDAGDTPSLRAVDEGHRRKILGAINAAFPSIGAIDREPGQGNAPIIGDTKPYMIGTLTGGQNLLPNIQAALANKQEITRLKLSPTGHTNSVLAGKIIAHDAGLGPSGLFGGNYTLIITPGSILDPAAKIRARPGIDNIVHIQRATTLPLDVIRHIGMGTALPAPIQFEYIEYPNPSYRFTINVMNQPISVDFDAQFRAQGAPAVYFAGNPTKNAFIAGAAINADNIQNIIKYIVIKNIGDALQVIWLLYIILTNDRANKDRYAMMTCDKVVWLRCLINNLSIFLTSGNKATYYGCMDAAAFTAGMKENMTQDVLANNDGVINMLRSLLAPGKTLEGNDVPVPGAGGNRPGLGKLVDRLVFSLTRTNAIIGTYLNSPAMIAADIDVFRTVIEQVTMFSPLVNKGNAYKLVRSFKAFLPKNVILAIGEIGISRLPFDPMNLFAAIRRDIQDQVIRNICSGLPVPEPDPLPVQAGGAYPDDWPGGLQVGAPAVARGLEPLPYNSVNWAYIEGLIGQPANRAKPGFIAYLLVTYFPELARIGYAHALRRRQTTIQMTSLISVNSIVETLTDSFISLNAANEFITEISPALEGRFRELDTAAITLCRLALPVIEYIFDVPPAIPVVGNQYVYVCRRIADGPPAAQFPLDEQSCLLVYGDYQTIYTEELSASYANGHVDRYNPFINMYAMKAAVLPDIIRYVPAAGEELFVADFAAEDVEAERGRTAELAANDAALAAVPANPPVSFVVPAEDGAFNAALAAALLPPPPAPDMGLLPGQFAGAGGPPPGGALGVPAGGAAFLPPPPAPGMGLLPGGALGLPAGGAAFLLPPPAPVIALPPGGFVVGEGGRATKKVSTYIPIEKVPPKVILWLKLRKKWRGEKVPKSLIDEYYRSQKTGRFTVKSSGAGRSGGGGGGPYGGGPYGGGGGVPYGGGGGVPYGGVVMTPPASPMYGTAFGGARRTRRRKHKRYGKTRKAGSAARRRRTIRRRK